MAYTVYSNYIDKIGLGITFPIDGSAKNGTETEDIRMHFRMCSVFFCGPIELNGATERDLRAIIGHVLC